MTVAEHDGGYGF